MSPLHIFLKFTQELAKKPVSFWSQDNRQKIPQEAHRAIERLKKTLENKKLEDTIAYKTLVALENAIVSNPIHELSFTETLATLVEIYKQGQKNEDTQELLDELSDALIRARRQTLEYHLALESIRIKCKKMTDQQKLAADGETIQKIGIFYVFEYTSQVLYEFTRISGKDKKKLMNDGLKTDAGNLPGYLPLENTFRAELCYKIFDSNLRDMILRVFYDFEAVCVSEDMTSVGEALKKFNLELLRAFRQKGLVEFKAMIYAPFGNHIPTEELIAHIEKVKIP